jgi:hypothetical protein
MDQDGARAVFDLADFVEDKNTSTMTRQLSLTNVAQMEEGQSSTGTGESEKIRVVRKKEKYTRKKSSSFSALAESPNVNMSVAKEGILLIIIILAC